ncbi:MAG: ABC transporter ATP-binding protein [Candidatus Bathyarchaeia archaeon]
MVNLGVKNITKKFGKRVAVDDVSIEVKDKEFYTLVGPPGAGKTTTFRIIAGFEKPDQGRVYYDDDDVTDLPPGVRGVGFFFENLALFPDKTGFENIAFPLRVRNIPSKETTKRVHEIAKMLHIEHILDRLPQTFSGGEAQRVALARTMIVPRKLLILDEPLSNVDALLRVNMRAELKRLKDDLEETILYSTHDPIEAMAISDRICVMNKGKVLQVDSPKRVFDNPNSLFVAKFLGSPPMNFIDCTLKESDDKAFLESETFHLDVTRFKGILKKEASGPELILGIRPEHISILNRPRSFKSIETQVYVTEPLGFKTVVDLAIDKENIIKAIAPPEVSFKVGDKKWIEFNLQKIHVIDKRTEKVIV